MSGPEILGKKVCAALSRDIRAFCGHHGLSLAAFADLAGLSKTQLSHRLIARVQWRAHEAARARAVMAIEPPPRPGRAKPAAPEVKRVEVPKVELSAAPVRMRTTELPAPMSPRHQAMASKSIEACLAGALRDTEIPCQTPAEAFGVSKFLVAIAKTLNAAGYLYLADGALRAAWHANEAGLGVIAERFGVEFDPFAGMEGEGSED